MMTDARTAHFQNSAVVIRLDGEPIATGIATVVCLARDFFGDNDESYIKDVRIDELFLTPDHPQFRKWNELVGRKVQPEDVWGPQKNENAVNLPRTDV